MPETETRGDDFVPFETETREETETRWVEYAKKRLLGRRIVGCRYLTGKETEGMGWYKRPLVIELSDGTILFPSMDDEGNDGGALLGYGPATKADPSGEELTFPVI